MTETVNPENKANKYCICDLYQQSSRADFSWSLVRAPNSQIGGKILNKNNVITQLVVYQANKVSTSAELWCNGSFPRF